MFVNCHLSDMMIYIAKLLSSFVQFLRESKSSLLRLESRRNDSVVVRTSLKSSFEDNNGVEKELAVTSVCCTIIPIKIKQNNVFFCKHRLYTESCEKTRHSLATFMLKPETFDVEMIGLSGITGSYSLNQCSQPFG